MNGEVITIGRALRETAGALAYVSHEEAALEARLLLQQALNLDTYSLLLKRDELFPEGRKAALRGMLTRRLTGEPIQYILGEWEFMGLSFRVTPAALIPRQDTETLAERGLRLMCARGYERVLDMCTGSGCVGISVAKLSGAHVTLSDISPDALALASENAALNGVQVDIVESDLFCAIDGEYDMILCNPPYIAEAEMAVLDEKVRRFEPELALSGGADGLDFYRRIELGYCAHLAEGGALLMEVGMGQAADVMSIFKKGRTINDLNGIARVVVIEDEAI